MNTEDEMLKNSELNIANLKIKILEHELDAVREFAIWMTGVYDFSSHPYFQRNRVLLDKNYCKDDIVELPIKWEQQQFPLGDNR